MPDDYSKEIADMAMRRAVLAVGANSPPPDAAAKANRISRATGIPATTVDSNLATLDLRVRAEQARRILTDKPQLAAWMSNPRNAAVANDDLDKMTKNDGVWRALPAPTPTLVNSLAGVWTSLTQSAVQARSGLLLMTHDWLSPYIGIPDSKPGAPQLGDYTVPNAIRNYQVAQLNIDNATPQFQSNFGRYIYGGASSLAQMVPSVAVGLVAGPEAGLGVAAAQQGIPAYAKYRSRGGTPGEALAGGVAEGAIEAITEKLPMGFLVDKLGKVGAGKFITGYLGRELPGELAATLGQNAVDTAIANPKKTWGQFWDEQPDQLAQTAVATLMAGGFFAGVHSAARRLGTDAQPANIPDVDTANAINRAMDAAAESKTRARDPEAFRDFVSRFTDGTSAEHLFVPAEALATYFQDHHVDYRDDDFWHGYANQIDEGLATGGDVVIPTADAAAYLSGTPVWEAIKKDARVSPGGASLSELESHRAQYEDAMERIGGEVAEQMRAAREADEPRQRVYQDIRDKLTNAGYTQEAAHLNAELVAQRYATRAERTGQALTGDETGNIHVNAVLPANLAPIVAKDAGDVHLQGVINTMRRGLGVVSDRKLFGDTLLEWISKHGGIEDKGGDLKAMGADTWHKGKPGKRKLIRPHRGGNQASMLARREQENANTPDELAVRAQQAGYFPAGERPTVNDLFDRIDNELRGKPTYAVHTENAPEGVDAREAARELEQILDQRGVDPARATDTEIRSVLRQFQQEQQGGLRQAVQNTDDRRSLEQPGGAGPRGQITFRNGQSIIDLFQTRNASTFIHEMNHHWAEELMADALSDDATPQIQADWNAVEQWFAANGHPVVNGQIPVEAHELWARGVERFLMEGKAPSPALRRVFDAFRSWLLHIYQLVDNLRSPITPEIRDVMGRLFATDEEIKQASERQHVADLFDEAAKVGMSEQEFAAYKSLATDARNEAHDQLLYKTMSTIRAERTQAWKRDEANIRGEVTTQVNRRPEFKALHYLRTGKMLDNPDIPAERVSLDKQWLVDHYGEGVLAQLPKGVPPLYKENGVHPDDVAAMVGFDTGDEMVRTLISLEDRKRELMGNEDKRSVRQALIDEETAQAMHERFGDPLNDGSIEEEALAAVQNDLQGEKMATELRLLGRRSNRTPTPYSLAKDWARGKVAESTVQEATSGAAIQRYSRAAAKAGKAAEAAMIKGDLDEAFRQKHAQMLNNALVSEANRVREDVTKARDRLANYAKRRTIASMDQDYLEQIHDLLERVEFRPRSQRSIERQLSFEAWAAEREAEGHDVVVPASFADSLGSTHWSRLSVAKLMGLDEAVHQIAHLGRFKQSLIDGQQQREFEAVVREAVEGIGNLRTRAPIQFDPSWSDRMKAGIEAFDAGLLKMETIVDWLDGGNSNGAFNRIVFRPISEAQSRSQDMTAEYFRQVREAMEAVPDVGRWADRVRVPELMDRETGQLLTLTRQRLVAMALNMGNEGNIQRLSEGYGWNRDAIMAVLNRELTTDDWHFVQKVWDIVGTLWPEIAALERRVNGVEPEKVDAAPLETSAGTMRGGYYPAVYDTTRDFKAESHAQKASDLLSTTYTRATTRASSTKDRLEKVRRPILLDLGVINRHLGEVIHDITHREAIINAHKFLSSTDVKRAVNETLGPAIRGQFQPWLKHVANQWAAERAGNEGIGKFMGRLRANTTAVGMGFRMSTVLTQIAGYSNSQEVIGGAWLSQAIAHSTAHPVEAMNFVMERSGEIRHRMDTLDRDIGSLMRRLDATPLKKTFSAPRDAMKFMYHGIGWADRIVVVPTWIAAYNKAIAGGAVEASAVYEADKAVRQSQGAGAAKDLAAIQRGTGRWGEALKLATMFYSYFSAVYQRQRTLGRDAATSIHEGRVSDLPGLMARAWWLLIVPPVLSQLISGHGPGDDEDWGMWSFKQMLFNALGPIPGVRDLIQPAWDQATKGRSFGYQLSPVQRAGETIVNVAGDAGSISQGKSTKHATKDVLDTVGYVTGLVPGQVSTATQFLVDVGSGSQSPETAGDWYRGLTSGKAQKK
ncbi:hypothetical protein [Sphingomonas asaccharolytica]|uniref:hypothetical protein n=1 Tax=Sphingomonas asaccharolytica TaxID=40681 RepID=UPI0008335F4F|nr:hypothetical protein [Sphingomonas asaccharolytica]